MESYPNISDSERNIKLTHYLLDRKDKNKISISKRRNYGIDLLRIISMINVIILHINLFSSLPNLKYNNPCYKSVWLLEIMCYWAVNGYGLISGIVGYRSYKFSNLIYIWIQASFYSEIISIYLYFIKRITKENLILSLFPILIHRHWYVNAYFFLYLFIPFINYGINNLNRKTYRNIIILFFVFYSIFNIIAIALFGNSKYNYLNNGYSSVWLMTLYIIGGYFGKYLFQTNDHLTLKSFILWSLIYFFSTFISSELLFYIESIKPKKGKIISNLSLVNYVSPTIVLQAISLIMLFSKLKINNKYIIKAINFFTPLTFNVTLVHLRIFSEKIFKIQQFFDWVINLSPYERFFKTIIAGIVFYIIFALMDYLRLLLFNQLRIKNFCLIIEKKFFY